MYSGPFGGLVDFFISLGVNVMVRFLVFGVWNAKKATASAGIGLGGWAGPTSEFHHLLNLRLCCLTMHVCLMFLC